MIYNVTIRGKDGRQKTIPIDSPDRAGVFAELKRRGISALRVRESDGKWIKAMPSATRIRASSMLLRGFVVGLLVVLLAAGIFFVCSHHNGNSIIARQRTGKSATYIRDVQSSRVAKNNTMTPDNPSAKQIKSTIDELQGANLTVYSTNCVTRPLDPDDPDSKLVTAANQEIGSLLSTELGEQPVPFPYSFQVKNGSSGDDSFLRSLKEKIVFRESDSSEKTAIKDRLLAAQLDLVQQIREGISFNDSMEAAYKLRVRAYETRKCFIEELTKMREQEPDLVEDGLKIVNESLANQGIKVISRENIGLDPEEEGEAQNE